MKLLSRLAIVTLVAIVMFTSCRTEESPEPLSTSGTENSNIRFTDATEASGIRFEHVPTRTKDKLLPEIMGGGVALADFNRDGAPDVLLVNSGVLGKPVRPDNSRNMLFMNTGKGKFVNETDKWNLTGTGYGQGVAIGDVDNDGYPDVFLTNYEGDNRLLRNTGVKFEDVTENAGLRSEQKWATGAGFLDYDNDGDLDLFVLRYVDFELGNPHRVFRNRMLIYSTPIYFNPEPDQLWENDGRGKFTDVTEKAGITKSGNGLALALGDLDEDGDIDAYVANDSDENHLWINDGKGRFEEIAVPAGTAYSEFGKEEGSMGADFSDTDGNGLLDIAVSNFQDEQVALYSQQEKLLFQNVSTQVGIGQSSLARLSFGIEFFDADNDGDEDLIVANGHIEDNVELNSDSVTFPQLNSLYENMGDGKFVDISDSAGNALADKQVSRGLAIADLDSDGDLDFVVVNNGGKAQIALNETPSKGNFVGLWLEGSGSSRSAIGTRLIAKTGDRTIKRQIMGAQSYLSISEFRILFGLGSAEKIDSLEIYWPGAEKQTLSDIAAGKYYYLKQDGEIIDLKIGELRKP
ncbi:MAG: CRTAC1 family protein [Acidobacteriota bacterium]|nr:CRTAC1 family protein [Acidobacteriota bacterium]MDH3529867.1 CRTAC1 family protein [Acidobacteriota bacterium]